MPGKSIPKTICGYRRENGRVGIRNHVIILPLDDLSNAACEAVAHNIKGTLALPHHYGRMQFSEDLQLHFRTLIGTGCNPNVAAVVVIGIEPGWTGRVVDGIAATAECVTLQAAAGFAVHLFPTGQGNVIGNPIEPVIKLTANPRTAREMSEQVDLDVSGILRREMTYDDAGDALIDMTIRTCNGRLTCAEVLGHREFVMTKLYRSA